MMDLYQELAIYTGRDIDLVRSRCQSAVTELAWRWPEFEANPIEFYRSTDLYLFDLTEWQNRLHQTGWHKWFLSVLAHLKPKSVLDFGGGIGEYTIDAHTAGVRDLNFLEVEGSPTQHYARQRFEKRGIDPGVYNEMYFDLVVTGRPFDLIVAMDVLEHVRDSQRFIDRFAELAEYVVADPDHQPYNTFFPQHISHPDLTTRFTNVGGNLWRRK